MREARQQGAGWFRVAIGRAIVREPAAFLFDEPLSNLDAALRVGMRLEISELHERLATTMVYVTHDQVEAMTMADKIVVLHAGHIEQVGSPRELYQRPTNSFVATFIGSPKMALIDVTRDGDRVRLIVSDNGPGVPPEVRAQLFTPFVTTRANGLGLGLVICRDIVAGFGGELDLIDSEDGATFVAALRTA